MSNRQDNSNSPRKPDPVMQALAVVAAKAAAQETGEEAGRLRYLSKQVLLEANEG